MMNIKLLSTRNYYMENAQINPPINPNVDNQQPHMLNIRPREKFGWYDFFSTIGNFITVSGVLLGLILRWGGPVFTFFGTLTSQVMNFLSNKAKRDENRILKGNYNQLVLINGNLVNLPTLSKSDKFGLEITLNSSFATIASILPALASSGLAFTYNGIQEEKRIDRQDLLIAAVALSLISPIAENIAQHYKVDNLNREKIMYKEAIEFFPPPPAPPVQNQVADNVQQNQNQFGH